MKNIISSALFTLLAVLPAFAADQSDQKLLAKFDDEALTVEEFAKRQPSILSWAGIGANREQIKGRVEDMVFDTLLAREAQSSGIAEQPDVKFQIQRILKSAYLKERVPKEGIEITQDDIDGFYRKNIERYRNPDLVKISHILFKTEAEAVSAKRRLSSESWDTLVSSSMDPLTKKRQGSLGAVPPQSLMPVLSNSISPLSPGETSAPIKSVFGYHLLRLDKAPPPSYRPVDDVRNEIYEELLKERQRGRVREVREELWDKYDVTLDEKAIDDLIAKNSAAQVDADLTLAGRRPKVVGRESDLQVISDTVDLGNTKNTPITERLLVGNTSNRKVSIERVGSTCPCITASINKQALEPGEVAELSFTYTPSTVGDRGRVERVLFIDSDDTVRPKGFFKLRFNVERGAAK
jgi:peptidyl-prolyl cis-trans isomerase C